MLGVHFHKDGNLMLKVFLKCKFLFDMWIERIRKDGRLFVVLWEVEIAVFLKDGSNVVNVLMLIVPFLRAEDLERTERLCLNDYFHHYMLIPAELFFLEVLN